MSTETIQLTHMRRGDAAAMRELYDEHAGAVMAFVRQRAPSAADAADIVQDVFTVALQAGTWKKFSGRTSFRAYLFGIARNHLLHLYRMRGIRERAANEPETWTDAVIAPIAGPDHLDEVDLVRGLLNELAPGERAFFEAHMMERPARRVTAERLGISEDQVRYQEKKLRMRALSYLKRVGYLAEEVPSRPAVHAVLADAM